MKKNYLNYNDEMAWKERRKQIKEENLVVENKGEYAELEAIKEGYTTFDDKYDVVFYNVPSVLVRNTQNKCSILIDAVQKYLEDTYGDMEYYEVFRDRYNDELYPRTFSIREILRDWNELRDDILNFIYDEIGTKEIKKYLPEDFKLSRPKKKSDIVVSEIAQNQR